MGYTPSFTPQYENGWEDLPSETSPITAEAFNAYDDAIENIEEYLASDESQANLADAYDETATYEAGDYVIYGGDLYKCLEDIDTPEEWDSTKWESCLITDEMATSGGTTVIANPSGEATDTLTKLQVENTIYGISGGGGNANIWTGTQAELEEVFDELEEGTQINITDDEQEVVEGGTIYSEEEQVIGLWTDNKPLYQKTIPFNALTSGANNKINSEITITNYKIVEFSGTVFLADGVNELAIPYVTSNQQLSAFFSDGVYVFVSSNLSVSSGYLTITYTKNADSPLDAVVGKSTMYIASSDCYSTEEKEVGCNVDGKPLYQKTFHSTNVALGANGRTVVYTTSDLSSLAIDNVVGEVSGYAIFGSGDANKIDIPYAIANSNGSIGAYYDNGYGICIHRLGNALTLNDLYLTLQYTKTTDTAGSGQYTPASGKAVHYSTDEQVIGTWIDGKPLYRRTLTGLSVALNGTNWVNYNPSIPIDKIVDLHAYYVTTSDTLLTCAIAEYQYTPTTGIQLTAVQSYNRTVNILTIEYTKTTD